MCTTVLADSSTAYVLLARARVRPTHPRARGAGVRPTSLVWQEDSLKESDYLHGRRDKTSESIENVSIYSLVYSPCRSESGRTESHTATKRKRLHLYGEGGHRECMQSILSRSQRVEEPSPHVAKQEFDVGRRKRFPSQGRRDGTSYM